MAEVGAIRQGGSPRGAGLPWTWRLLEALPVAPFWGGLLLAVAQYAFFQVYKHLAGEPLQVLPDLVFALLVGAAPAASVYARRAALRCLEQLRPALEASDAEREELGRELTAWDPFWPRLIGVISLVVSLVIVLNEPGVVGPYPPGHPVLPLVIWMNLAAIWLATRSITHELIVSRRFARLGRERTAVELLDPGPLTAFGRRGVQGALVPILLISVFSLLFVSGSAGDAVPFTQAFVVVLSALSLLLPVHGVHRRLAEQKRERLARLARALREAEAPVLAARPGQAPAEAAHLQALLALRAQLEGASEWPWDLPTLVRFVLYVAIGLGSWLGGALVERIVDAALG